MAGPFIAAGTLRWRAIWIYMGVIASGSLLQRLYVKRHNPRLLERKQSVGSGTARWDILWTLFAGPLVSLPPILAGYGVRVGWPQLAVGWLLLGVVANSVGGLIWARSMAANPHFESTVRIQRELGHVVVEHGPYRFVRHPGYLGFCIGSLGAPLMLQSWPAFAVGSLLPIAFVVRTALEDRLLQRELPGYAAYARRVRYRLLPRVW